MGISGKKKPFLHGNPQIPPGGPRPRVQSRSLRIHPARRPARIHRRRPRLQRVLRYRHHHSLLHRSVHNRRLVGR